MLKDDVTAETSEAQVEISAFQSFRHIVNIMQASIEFGHE